MLLFTKAILELQSEKYLKIIDEDEVLQMDQKDKSLFVFSSFTSPAFMHCQKVRLLQSCEIQRKKVDSFFVKSNNVAVSVFLT